MRHVSRVSSDSWIFLGVHGSPGLHTGPVDDAARVLVIEDDRELAVMLTRLLTSAGYAVTHAPDGQRGLHLGADH